MTVTDDVIGTIPIIVFPTVAHMGTLDQSLKNDRSYEGKCLSVSLLPESWAQIARLGEKGFLLTGRGHFLDVHTLTESQKRSVVNWGLVHGLLQMNTIFHLHHFDVEFDRWEWTEFHSRGAAEKEIEEMGWEPEYADFRIEEIYGHVGTGKLAEMSGSDLARSGGSIAFDLVLIVLASLNAALDGLWWNDEYDPIRYSAPRGGIFPERISLFKVTHATWTQLQAFEMRE